MSNEELVALIQAGDRGKLLELWAQIRRLVWKQANRWAVQGGVEPEDLMQEGFIAMLRAVDGYDSTRGTKFSTVLSFYFKGAFAEATGQRTQRQKRDPLQTAYSLDAPLTDDEGDPFTLADVLPDQKAEAVLVNVDELDFSERRRAAVEEALSTLPAELQEAIRAKYYLNERTDPLAHAKALRLLRHPSRSRALMAYW